jgi:hypothetical protein
MAFRQSIAYKVLLMVMSLACLAAAGYLVWQTLKPTPSLDEIYKQAEASYNQGEEAFAGGNFAQAAEKFDTARKQVEQVLGSIEKQREQAKAAGKEFPKADELKQLEAKAHYLRARAIRDTHHAQSAADDKPIPESHDSTTGEKYRSFKAIADVTKRDQASASLYHAAGVLTKERLVLKDAVRLELTSPPFDWERLSKNLSAMLELDAKDARAHYWLARYDFFQPQKDAKGYEDTDPSKRSLERVDRSLRAVRKAKELGTQPPWRLIDLEARALEWLADKTLKKKATEPARAEEELRILILNPSDGAAAILRKSDKLDLPTSYDLQGVLTAQMLAVKFAANDLAKPGFERKTLIAALRDFLNAAAKARESTAGKSAPGDITLALLEALSIAQPMLSSTTTADWADLFDKYLEATSQTQVKNASKPAIMTLLRSLLAKEITRSADKGDSNREKNLRKWQKDYVESGLKEAVSGKVSRAELIDLHARALELKLLSGATPDEMTPHLKELATEPAATRPAIASFADGLIAWRQGKFARARESLEASLRYRDRSDYFFGAQWLLYQIYTAIGQYGLALNALGETEAYLNRKDQPNRYSGLDRLALGDAPIEPDDLVAHLAAAHVEVAYRNIKKQAKETPDTPPPPEMYATAEKVADAALKKLRTPTAADLYLRLALFRLRQVEQRKEQADEVIKSLRRDYSDSVAVLAASADWLATPLSLTTGTPKPSQEGIKEADALIEEYCATHPRDTAGKLLHVEWLVRTKRMDAAIALLREPSNLDQAIGGELLRLFAHVRGYPLVAGVAREIVDTQPSGVELAAALVRAIVDQQREPGALISPFRIGERRARQALRTSAGILADGQFEDAARGFAEVLAVADLTDAAREGLWHTIRSAAAVDPTQARNLCIAIAADQPNEPVLYFGAALTALLKGDIGQIRDSWERTQSMTAALNRWEQTARKTGADPADLNMIRAQFWIAVGRPALARNEVALAVAHDRFNPAALVFMARQSLSEGKEDSLKVAQKYWNSAVAVDPDDLGARCLEAEIKARRGEFSAAVRVAQDVIRDHPRSSRAYATLVQVGLEKKDGAEIVAWMRQWLKALPCDSNAAQHAIQILIRRGQFDEARAAADDFLAGSAVEIARRADELQPMPGNVAFDNWQRNAKTVADRAQTAAWHSVVSAFREAGQGDAAKSRLQAALEKSPDSEVLLMLHAEMAAAADRWTDAATDYRKILAKNPRQISAAAALIRLTPHLKDTDAAFRVITDFNTAANVDMLDPQAFSLDLLVAIGEVHELFTAPKQRSALRHVMVESLARFPNDPRIQLYAGKLHYVQGDGMRAAECLQRALRLARAEEGSDISADERKRILQAAQQALDRLRSEPKTGNSDA